MVNVTPTNAKRFLGMFTDPKKLQAYSARHSTSIAFWCAFFVAGLTLYHLCSDGDFSFLLTLSSMVSMFSFAMVLVKIMVTNSVAGISARMMECYVVLIVARLCSIIPFEGYLPYDKSGDWLYQTVETSQLLLAGAIVYMCRSRFTSTYDNEKDTLNHLFLIVPTVILALLFHPSLNSFMPADCAWAFALYLESVACLPQLLMFQRQEAVKPFTVHFLAGQALSKLLCFVFWLPSYKELNDPTNTRKSFVGNWVIIMQLIQLLVMGDFMYHYIRALQKGKSMAYFLSDTV